MPGPGLEVKIIVQGINVFPHTCLNAFKTFRFGGWVAKQLFKDIA